MLTFGKKIGLGFALAFALLLAIGAVAYHSVNTAARMGTAVAHTHLVLERISDLQDLLITAETEQRGYIISGDAAFLVGSYRDLDRTTGDLVRDLRDLLADNSNQGRRLDEAGPLIAAKIVWMLRTTDTRRTGGFEPSARLIASGQGNQLMTGVRRILGQMKREEEELLQRRADAVLAAAATFRATMVFGTLLCLVLLAVAGVAITRGLTHQIGSAVQHIQGSSGKLQSAANQQVSATREQATAMSEITTTMNELLSSARQIGESAQRVWRISTDTGSAARKGDETVQRTQESLGAIKRQVDVIVAHMLDLGRKSQQIGSILEIINELAEQTNILAINATIEAAGAGEMGKRFAAVAEEIRRLADRVGGSTKDIRGLVDDVRAAVNTTVMATESGSKAVDAGTRQFGEVAASFKLIAGSVTTTTEAAKEIELSTKQQTSAVEQVNVAVADLSQATGEMEASAGQTLLTSSDLIGLSRNLVAMIKPKERAVRL
jgi:methyl-accepting chemotaxis protein